MFSALRDIFKRKYTVSMASDGAYVLVDFHVPLTGSMQWRYIKQALELSSTMEKPAFLFDARGAPNRRTIQEDYRVYDYTQSERYKGCKVALVVDKGDNSYHNVHIIAKDAGYDHRVFTSPSEAEAWLRE